MGFGVKLAEPRDPAYRAAMLTQTLDDIPPMNWRDLFVLSRDNPRYDPAAADSLAARAAALGLGPPDAFIEFSLVEDGLTLFNFPSPDPEMDAVEYMLDNPNIVLGLGDFGAIAG